MALGVTLTNKLPEIQLRLNSEEFNLVLAAATETVAEAARANAPVETGALRESIEVKPIPDTNDVGVFMAWYGPFVEHGTVNAPPRPFLVPAAESRKEAVAETVAIWVRSL